MPRSYVRRCIFLTGLVLVVVIGVLGYGYQTENFSVFETTIRSIPLLIALVAVGWCTAALCSPVACQGCWVIVPRIKRRTGRCPACYRAKREADRAAREAARKEARLAKQEALRIQQDKLVQEEIREEERKRELRRKQEELEQEEKKRAAEQPPQPPQPAAPSQTQATVSPAQPLTQSSASKWILGVSGGCLIALLVIGLPFLSTCSPTINTLLSGPSQLEIQGAVMRGINKDRMEKNLGGSCVSVSLIKKSITEYTGYAEITDGSQLNVTVVVDGSQFMWQTSLLRLPDRLR